MHFRKHKVITEMQQELLRLIQFAEPELEEQSLDESKLAKEAGLAMPPSSP